MADNLGQWINRKTFKRELAMAVLIFWFVITVRVFWYLDKDTVRALDTAYGMLSTTIWLFVAAAFGMDWASKQMGDPRFRYRVESGYQRNEYREDFTYSRGNNQPSTPTGRPRDPTIPPVNYGGT